MNERSDVKLRLDLSGGCDCYKEQRKYNVANDIAQYCHVKHKAHAYHQELDEKPNGNVICAYPQSSRNRDCVTPENSETRRNDVEKAVEGRRAIVVLHETLMELFVLWLQHRIFL